MRIAERVLYAGFGGQEETLAIALQSSPLEG